jgi:hypothetical protein
MKWFTFLLLLCSCLDAQDDPVEQRLVGLIQTRAPSRQQSYDPFIEALASSRVLASELGLSSRQLLDIEKLLERRKSLREKLWAERPKETWEEPPEPEMEGLSRVEADRVIDEYDELLSKFHEARHLEHDEYRLYKEQSNTEFALEFSETIRDALTDQQKVRFGQIILQSQMGQKRPLGIYFNQSLHEWVKLTPSQFETMRQNAKIEQHELAISIRDLVEKYHDRIRETLPEREKSVVQQTLMNDPKLTAKGPTKVSDKVLELEYLNSQGIVSAFSLIHNSWSLNSSELIEFLDLVDKQKEAIQEIVAQYSHGKGDESFEARCARLSQGDRILREDVLLPFQVRFLAQQVIMATLNKPKPFGIYQQEGFRDLFELTYPEFIRISNASKDVVPEFLAELKSLLKEAHNEVRVEMPQTVKEQLEIVFGDPFLITMAHGR